jgi:hypothetical protein
MSDKPADPWKERWGGRQWALFLTLLLLGVVAVLDFGFKK